MTKSKARTKRKFKMNERRDQSGGPSVVIKNASVNLGPVVAAEHADAVKEIALAANTLGRALIEAAKALQVPPGAQTGINIAFPDRADIGG